MPPQPKTSGQVKPAREVGVREWKVRRAPSKLLGLLRLLGPGIITGASDDDPSGIATYSVAGASFGYATLWTALFSLPMMAVAQYMCAKIGLVTGRGLAAILRSHYPKYVLFPLVFALVIANSINAGTDIGAIAAAVNLMLPVPIIALIVPIAVIILALQIWLSYRVVALIFKWLTLALFAYIGAAIFAHPDWLEVLRATFLPSIALTPAYLTTLVAVLGTTISPYMFFWQATQEVEEDIVFGRTSLALRKGTTAAELRYAEVDIFVGMLFSQIVMYFIIIATAATLHAAGHTTIATAADAAKALAPLAGKGAALLLAAGLIGTGLLAVPILTGSSAYALANAFGWKSGLSQYPAKAPQFYSIIAFSTLIGVLVNFLGINPVKALFWTAVINGVLAPVLLVFIIWICNDKRVMGSRTNSVWANLVAWTTAAAMTAAAVLMFVFWRK